MTSSDGPTGKQGKGAVGAGLIVVVALAAAPGPVPAADELSGADKLRALYSAEFRFTDAGLPVVPIAIAEDVAEVTVAGEGLRLLPEGDGGPEIRADDGWSVRASQTTPARLRRWTVVWRGRAHQGAEAAAARAAWNERGEKTQIFEQGTLFGVAGEVLDRRELVVVVGPVATVEAAERAAERLRAKTPLAASGVFTELVDRPHGQIEALGLRTGARVRNEGVLWFAPAGDKPLRIEWLRAWGKGQGRGAYHGRVYVTLDRQGRLAVVNAVPEDRLLAGLVPAEIFPSAPDEALRAQAVAARGELLAKIGTRHTGDPFRICSETHCQVYAGAGRETPRTTAAVAATRGEVLFMADGKDLADTVYSASCGGHTEHNENVWPDMPALPVLRGHRDGPPGKGADALGKGVTEATLATFLEAPPPSWCGLAKQAGGAERFRWAVTRSAAELRQLLAGLAVGPVRSIEVLERGVSGRARAVRVTGATRAAVVRGELRIRQTFGGLRSSLFGVTVKDGAATFRGAGFGHGVGLCQMGAIGMAEAGKSYQEILRHYYQGSVLRKLW